MNIIEQLQERNCRSVIGTHLCLREPTYGQIDRCLKLPDDLQKSLLLALSLVDATGAPVIPKLPDENDIEFAARADAELNQLPMATMNAITAELRKMLTPPEPLILAQKLLADPEALFVSEFGRALGRADFWNLRGEHTPLQWIVQKALFDVAPFGEIRADKRAAICAANLMAMQASEKLSDDEFGKIVTALQQYLPKEDAYQDVIDLQALKLLEEKFTA